ncbi:hypothetical protein D9758_018246 [Tetrapyrgos nigripes]|uniref:Uncharacterized protein n=1 Tax=Tetrapyrgos nigripes TaxID=182062 RepID=A0A8H5FEN8_9AGAR|nr:hypothetical protein D9758_018246 [Tetrapyrgos nigripes]
MFVCAAGSPSPTSHSQSQSQSHKTITSGIYIQTLQLSTSFLSRCNPADIRTILDYAPRLVVFEDLPCAIPVPVYLGGGGMGGGGMGMGIGMGMGMGIGGGGAGQGYGGVGYGGGGGSMRRNLMEEVVVERDGGVGGMVGVLLGLGVGVGVGVGSKSGSGGSSPKSLSFSSSASPLPLKKLTWTSYGDGADLEEVERVLLGRQSQLRQQQHHHHHHHQLYAYNPYAYSALEYLELDLSNSGSASGINGVKAKVDGHRVTLPALHTLVLTLSNSALGRLARWDLPRLRNLGIKAGNGSSEFDVDHDHSDSVHDDDDDDENGFGFARFSGNENEDESESEFTEEEEVEAEAEARLGGLGGIGMSMRRGRGLRFGFGGETLRGLGDVENGDFDWVVKSWGRRREGWRDRQRQRHSFTLTSFSPSARPGPGRGRGRAEPKRGQGQGQGQGRQIVKDRLTLENMSRMATRTGWELFFLAHGEKVRVLELDAGGGHNFASSFSPYSASTTSASASTSASTSAFTFAHDASTSAYASSEVASTSSSGLGSLQAHAHSRNANGNNPNPQTISQLLDTQDALLSGGLPLLLPNLRVFITDAGNGSWDWTRPDWIAPHALLPSHEGVEIVGLRGLEGRVWGDWGEWVGDHRDREQTTEALLDDPSSRSPLPPYLDPLSSDDSPFFMLLEQLTSLLQPETFPSLKYIRDLSEASDLIRRGEVGVERGWGWGGYAGYRRVLIERERQRQGMGRGNEKINGLKGKGKSGDKDKDKMGGLRRSFSRLGLNPSGSAADAEAKASSPSPPSSWRTRLRRFSSLGQLDDDDDDDDNDDEGSTTQTQLSSPVSPSTPTQGIAGFAPVVMTTTTMRVEEVGVDAQLGAAASTRDFKLLQPPLPTSSSRSRSGSASQSGSGSGTSRSRSNTVTSMNTVSSSGVSTFGSGSTSTAGSIITASASASTASTSATTPPHTPLSAHFPSSSLGVLSTSSSSFNLSITNSYTNLDTATTPTLPSRLPAPHHPRIIRFWQRLLERTKARGVWLEDWRGLNVTGRELEKWRRGFV